MISLNNCVCCLPWASKSRAPLSGYRWNPQNSWHHTASVSHVSLRYLTAKRPQIRTFLVSVVPPLTIGFTAILTSLFCSWNDIKTIQTRMKTLTPRGWRIPLAPQHITCYQNSSSTKTTPWASLPVFRDQVNLASLGSAIYTVLLSTIAHWHLPASGEPLKFEDLGIDHELTKVFFYLMTKLNTFQIRYRYIIVNQVVSS